MSTKSIALLATLSLSLLVSGCGGGPKKTITPAYVPPPSAAVQLAVTGSQDALKQAQFDAAKLGALVNQNTVAWNYYLSTKHDLDLVGQKLNEVEAQLTAYEINVKQQTTFLNNKQHDLEVSQAQTKAATDKLVLAEKERDVFIILIALGAAYLVSTSRLSTTITKSIPAPYNLISPAMPFLVAAAGFAATVIAMRTVLHYVAPWVPHIPLLS